MTNTFLEHIAKNYEQLKQRFQAFCQNKHYTWDYDIFQDTILKCAELIDKKGLKDDSAKGCENYLFKAFKTNLQREKQYSRNQKRDANVTNVSELFEDWYNSNNVSSQEKLTKDLKTDFSALYLLSKVDEQYGGELSHLFTEKYYLGETYKQLQKKHPNIPKLRDQLLDMKRWLMSTVSKEEIDRAFQQKFGELEFA